MPPALLLAGALAYFAALYAVAWHTSRRADSADFFVGSRASAWPLVAFGMIGTSLSGVTFVSVPGAVGHAGFGYWQIVLGQLLGYAVVAALLLPLYYAHGGVSIYAWLGRRFGPHTWRSAALLFIVSRTLGATARLYLVVRILQDVVLAPLGMPFALSAALLVAMILAYTWRGGVKTIVWTDTLQTAGMLGGLVACTAILLGALQLSPAEAFARMQAEGLARLWGTVPSAADWWPKQLLAGAAIAIAMTGLDQEMMQKSISVRTLRGAQKNLVVMALAMLVVVLLFLFLGGLLVMFAQRAGIVERGDRLFPAVVMGHLPLLVQGVFVLALISALFPSADGALTALTSSACNDLLGFERRSDLDEAARLRLRHRLHAGFAVLFLLLVLGFRWLDDPSMVGLILKIAAYTYGPLLGLFVFGVGCRRRVRDGWVPLVALAAPLLCGVLDACQAQLFAHWRIGLEMLLLNAALTALGLWLVSRPAGPR